MNFPLLIQHPKTHVLVIVREDRVQTKCCFGLGGARPFAYMLDNARSKWTAQDEIGLLLKRGWKALSKETA